MQRYSRKILKRRSLKGVKDQTNPKSLIMYHLRLNSVRLFLKDSTKSEIRWE